MRLRHICVLLLPLLLFRPESAPSIERVVLGYSGVGSGEEVHHFAKEVGLFRKHGLDVEIVYIAGGATVVQAVIAGEGSVGRGPGTGGRRLPLSRFPVKI